MAKFKVVQSSYGPILVNPNDKFIAPSIEQTGTYSPDDIHLLTSLVEFLTKKNNQAVFYDVGANFGIHTLAIASRFGPAVSVRAFEAQPQLFYGLCGTVALNGLTNVRCHNLAISDGSCKTIQFDLPDYDSPNNFGGLELVPARISDNSDMTKVGKETISCATLSDFDERVDLIKMDIEGMEYLALCGASRLFDLHRPICFVEILKSDTNQIQTFFAQKKYHILPFSGMDWLAIPSEFLDGGFVLP